MGLDGTDGNECEEWGRKRWMGRTDTVDGNGGGGGWNGGNGMVRVLLVGKAAFQHTTLEFDHSCGSGDDMAAW